MKPEYIKKESDQFRQELKSYLEDKTAPFAVGFELMIKFSIKVSLIHMIGNKRNQPVMRKKMDYELGKIAERPIIKLSPYANKAVMAKVHPAVGKLLEQNNIANEKGAEELEIVEAMKPKAKAEGEKLLSKRLKVITTKKEVTPEEMPTHIRKEWDKARKYFHVANHYHTKMKVVETDEERAEALKLAKEYEELSKAAWTVIDAWGAEGKPSEEKEETAQTAVPADVARAIGSAKSYISRYATSLEEKKGKAYEDRKEKLEDKVKTLLDNAIAIPEPAVAVLKKHGIIG